MEDGGRRRLLHLIPDFFSRFSAGGFIGEQKATFTYFTPFIAGHPSSVPRHMGGKKHG